MAVITSATTGNFSAPGTWVGGVVPTSVDDAVAATGTVVTIDTNVTVLSFQQAGTGKFVLGGGRTVTGNVIANAGTFTSGGTVEVTATTGQTATINGNVTGVSTTASNVAGIVVSGTGTLTVNGSITGSAGNASSDANGNAAIYTNTPSTINVTGIVTAGSGNNKRAIWLGSSATTTLTITGDLIGNGNSAYAVYIQGSNCILNSTSTNILGGSSDNGLAIHSSPANSIINLNASLIKSGTGINGGCVVFNGITGTVTATIIEGNSGGGNSAVFDCSGASTSMTVTANLIKAGTGGAGYGIYMRGASSTLNVTGLIQAVGALIHGIRSDSTSGGVVFQGNLTDSLQGATAIYSRLLRVTATNTGTTTYTNTIGYPNGTPVTRVSPNLITGMPATNNVRSGTVYGFNNELTGSVAIPPAGSVALGAQVDNTVGTAALDAGTVIAVVGQQVAAASSSPSVV